MDFTNLKTKLQSKKYKDLVIILALIVASILVFAAGVEVGYMKASFNFHSGEEYYRAFGPGPHAGLIPPNDVGNAHGVNGKIVSIELPTFVVADNDNTEKVVRIDDDTVTRELRQTITPNDLKNGDFVVVIGSPDDKAEIEAKFIRVMPQPAPVVTPVQTAQ